MILIKVYIVTASFSDVLHSRHVFYQMEDACQYAAFITESSEEVFCYLEVGNEEETDNGCIKISFRDG